MILASIIIPTICTNLLNARQGMAQWLQLGHYKVNRGNFVVLDVVDGMPDFCYVETIVCIGDDSHFLVKQMNVHYYNQHFHAYLVSYDSGVAVSAEQSNDLKDHIPLFMHTVTHENKRHIFVFPR
jgi:hypothetical protein